MVSCTCCDSPHTTAKGGLGQGQRLSLRERGSTVPFEPALGVLASVGSSRGR
jgi:hypothetical protein